MVYQYITLFCPSIIISHFNLLGDPYLYPVYQQVCFGEFSEFCTAESFSLAHLQKLYFKIKIVFGKTRLGLSCDAEAQPWKKH